MLHGYRIGYTVASPTKESTMRIDNFTHPTIALSWEKFNTAYKVNTAYKGKSARFEYCADGDGFIVVRETKDGYKLFEQGQYIKSFSDLLSALTFAEHFMQTCGYADMYEQCLTY